MSVVGIDFGTLHSKIGVARHRGIDIITNEVSNRATPSLVAFGPKQRAIGESAKTQETSNFKNTIGSLKRLIGRTLNDPDVEAEKKFLNAKLIDLNGQVGTQVNYIGEQQTFTATQLTAMYLAKLRDIAAAELKTGVTDVVIAIPGWFTDIQRRALLDAASIANLNVLRLINDSTATALGYGITKSDLPEADNPKHVCFVDVGHSSLSVTIVAFSKGQLIVKSSAYDRHLGGRDIDFALVRHFAEEFKSKYKIDVLSNPKATFRLAAGCEKLKKVLSANAEAPLSVESIMNDIDASSKLTREQMESLISEVLDRIVAPVQQAFKDSELTLDQIDAIELIGGSTRVPAVRARIQEAFPGKVLSTTLNQDEAIARGATFACAMLSPVFRVRDFHVHDVTYYPIKVQWEPVPTDPDDDTELVVYPKGNGIPSTKVLTFYRKEPFDIEARYAEPEGLPGGINPWISRFSAKEVPADPKGDVTCVKLKTKLNIHGITSFETAYVEEIEEKEEAPAAPMDVDPPADGAPAVPPKKKKIVKKKEIKFVTGTSSLDKTILEQYREQEAQMYAADKLVQDTEDCKNALEEYVYDMRGKLDDRYAAFNQPQEKQKLLAALQEAEEWLYSEEGEDATKSAYVTRLDALKVIGDPISNRYRQNEDRPRFISQLRETLNLYMSQATSADEKYAHIDAKDKQSVVEKVATVQKWLDDQVARQAERPKNVDPALTSEEIQRKRDEVIYFATPIMTRPKPKVVPTPGTDTPKNSGTETPKNDGNATPEPPKAEPSNMDVD
ncbi:adenyl-nucleotide exchange factor sse1 [Pleurotus pulmonarius]|nr:adenyl-nucleotide exchange factor sse1 [Pleurotus pulmonarius]KAF4585032.1 adenyl-nucleotide exchange factor sse1 [Pleurotus pulmonarius]KAF4607364.1 adenyl-nucleotide exchange factor sse1 [Pleurotus pulmonarius]